MPELPEVETVRRMLEHSVLGRTVRRVQVSGKSLRIPVPRNLTARLKGRTLRGVGRHGKYLLLEFDGDLTLLSHLGMSGRWLFHAGKETGETQHVHCHLFFTDSSELRFQDPRRFGLLKTVATGSAFQDPLLAILGPDPVLSPPTGETLSNRAKGTSIAVKNFLLDQRRLAGIGNIYASEILHRARVDPRRKAGSLSSAEWRAVAAETQRVLGAAIDRMGTTFSTYRTLWNEPGSYGDQLLVYDRANQPCRRCGGSIRRIVQGQRSTYFCPGCQPRGRGQR